MKGENALHQIVRKVQFEKRYPVKDGAPFAPFNRALHFESLRKRFQLNGREARAAHIAHPVRNRFSRTGKEAALHAAHSGLPPHPAPYFLTVRRLGGSGHRTTRLSSRPGTKMHLTICLSPTSARTASLPGRVLSPSCLVRVVGTIILPFTLPLI